VLIEKMRCDRNWGGSGIRIERNYVKVVLTDNCHGGPGFRLAAEAATFENLSHSIVDSYE
jgi:hypothetical protein